MILFASLVSCSKRINHFAYNDVKNHRIDNKQTNVDSQLMAMIAPYKTALDVQMNEVIGYTSEEMVKNKPSSNLTNWVTDAILNGYKNKTNRNVDLVLLNYGGIRLNALGKGDIIVGEVYELLPFENYFVIVEADGVTTKALLDKAAQLGGWPISENSSFTIKDSIATDVVIDGKPFDINKTYKIGLPDYVANGGDECSFLKTAPREDSGILVRDLLMFEIKRVKNTTADSAKRIKIWK